MDWNENEYLEKWPEMRMAKMEKMANNKRGLGKPFRLSTQQNPPKPFQTIFHKSYHSRNFNASR